MPDNTNPFTDAVREMRRWSSQARPGAFAKTTCINFVFDSGTANLTAGASRICKVGFTGYLNAVEIFADFTNTNATFSLSFGDKYSWPVQTPLHGTSLSPRIAGLVTPFYSGELDLTNYFRYIRINDILFCRLLSVFQSHSIVLSLTYKLLEAPGLGGAVVIEEESGEAMTLDTGELIDVRF